MGIQDDYLDPDRHLYNNEEPEHVSDAWKEMNALYGAKEDNRDEEYIKSRVYKYTECGAFIEFDESGIAIGSIVEGCDNGQCDTYHIPWRNITQAAITERLEAIEAQADVIWKWANETRDDGQTDAEAGLDFPDIATDYKHLHSFEEKD